MFGNKNFLNSSLVYVNKIQIIRNGHMRSVAAKVCRSGSKNCDEKLRIITNKISKSLYELQFATLFRHKCNLLQTTKQKNFVITLSLFAKPQYFSKTQNQLVLHCSFVQYYTEVSPNEVFRHCETQKTQKW